MRLLGTPKFHYYLVTYLGKR